MIASDTQYLIFGCGKTGQSVARFMHSRSLSYVVFDTRDDRALFSEFWEINANTRCVSGDIEQVDLSAISRVILSPGISIDDPAVALIREKNIEVIGDVALFLELANAPVIGITGSNGKSTVTTLVGMSARRSGKHVAVGGNIGVPALDLLGDDIELYVLEVSSFQLETIPNASFDVACHLNVSEDHLDRHGSLENYIVAKQKIFFGTKAVVYKLNDPLTHPPVLANVPRFGFGIHRCAEENEKQFYLNDAQTELMTGTGGNATMLMPVSDVKVRGLHNIENVLATFAICDAAGIDRNRVCSAVSAYPGLRHRCEFIADSGGVVFINDSKATNTGSSIAAIQGLKSDVTNIVVILGGLSKGANFNLLASIVVDEAFGAVLLGEGAPAIYEAIHSAKIDRTTNAREMKLQHCEFAEDMHQAVFMAYDLLAKNGEQKPTQCGQTFKNLVLLSPACASFDMFRSFEERGDAFATAVAELAS